ncbi:MAG: hypothetical protein ACF8PN_07405 [Phycisphaerales bacterium]
MPTNENSESHDPYCSNCGYKLTGLTESAKCPECGRPLVETLMRPSFGSAMGRRYRSTARVGRMPFIDLAFGPAPGESKGKPRGFIAIGDEPLGVIAIGGVARGVVAIGGMALGVFSMGGMSVGLLTALGGMAAGAGFSAGGGAIGAFASGGGAVGYMAQGGGAYGYFARGGGVGGMHTVGPRTSDPAAIDAFDTMSWYFGPSMPNPAAVWGPMLVTLCLVVGMGLALAVIGRALAREPVEGEEYLHP